MEMMDISDLPHTDLGPRLSLPPPTYTALQPVPGETYFYSPLDMTTECGSKIRNTPHTSRVTLYNITL